MLSLFLFCKEVDGLAFRVDADGGDAAGRKVSHVDLDVVVRGTLLQGLDQVFHSPHSYAPFVGYGDIIGHGARYGKGNRGGLQKNAMV